VTRILALDYGRERTGVAMSDPTGTLATPLDPVPRVGSPAGLAALLAIVQREQPDLIVVGLPRTPSGELGAQARATQGFVGRLRKACPVPIEMEDERFTTTIARRSGSSGARASVDSRAAAVLLQGVLDRRASADGATGA
jgi:putative Holliday junction resolvase